MRRFSGFFANSQGSALEKFAISAVVVTIAGIASANFLSRMALNPRENYSARNEKAMKFDSGRNEQLAGMGSLTPTAKNKAPAFDNVDTTPTASVSILNGRPVILDPCTGKTKEPEN